ncbi:unnamed protein product [Lactuca virosa]|uniref:Uncharacterized protein n=1 Tax=Lactuca virosa TaxID=75947 RepID=A0AAU9LR98_9ASTR|nr:unnamed protein product [Lactuca virosa]
MFSRVVKADAAVGKKTRTHNLVVELRFLVSEEFNHRRRNSLVCRLEASSGSCHPVVWDFVCRTSTVQGTLFQRKGVGLIAAHHTMFSAHEIFGITL